MNRAVRVRQREVDVLARGSDEAARRAEILLQRDREGVRRPDLVRRVRRDRDLRVHERLDRVAAVRRHTVGLDRERRRAGHRRASRTRARSPSRSSSR